MRAAPRSIAIGAAGAALRHASRYRIASALLSHAMGREPSSLRPGQHACSGASFLATVPAAGAAVLVALRFVFARHLLSPLVTALSYWAGKLC